MIGNGFSRVVTTLSILVVLLLNPASLAAARTSTENSDKAFQRLQQENLEEPASAKVLVSKRHSLRLAAKKVLTHVPFLSREELIRRCRERKAALQRHHVLSSGTSAQSGNSGNGGSRPGQCGNGSCQADKGETCTNCAKDCGACPTCDNCESGEDASCSDCKDDPGEPDPVVGCGDGICAWPFENLSTCRIDCPCQTPFGGPLC